MREEVTGGSADTLREMKSGKIGGAGHVTYMGKIMYIRIEFCPGKLKGRSHLEDPGLDETLILMRAAVAHSV